VFPYVSEVFGPTFQGEGPFTGQRCSFLRLGLCNLTCEWCDTPFTWDRTRYNLEQENPPRTVGAILDELARLGPELVVVSGGEPLIHLRQLYTLFRHGAFRWHVETNGTISPPLWWDLHVEHTSVSPKINTRDPVKRRLKSRALAQWADRAALGHACFKFVCKTPADLEVVDGLVEKYGIPGSAVWIMPEGVTVMGVLRHHRRLAPHILERGYHTTTRLHTLLWGNERGH
jgi:organic radical activating enzyme